MLMEEPKNFSEDKKIGKYTVIGKEDKEREHFGSGGGKVIWKKGAQVKGGGININLNVDISAPKIGPGAKDLTKD